VEPHERSIGILAQDEALLAVDKPPGITVIPEAYQRGASCLTHLLEARWGRLWVVHRIDRDTSGVVLFARTAEAHATLNDQFAQHRVSKTYHLLARGSPLWQEMEVDAPLRSDGDARHRTVVDARGGKSAATQFRVLERFRSFALLEARPVTGRTHQIRVHAAHVGHPVVADPLYGDGEPLRLSALKPSYKPGQRDERPLLGRTALHALVLELLHPCTLEPMRVTCAYPRDMAAAVAQLSKLSRR
jgi:RluA family pseudouridine synthase